MKADLELIEEVKQGNTPAFSELVMRYQKKMMRIAFRLTKDLNEAEDVVQESFIKAFQKLDTFEGRASFKSWLYQITLNTAKNKIRSSARISVGTDGMTIGVNETAHFELAEKDVRDSLKTEIDKLPQRQRVALTLRVFDDLSFREIAEIMECPYDTAKANYRHALMKLKTKMKGNQNYKFWQERDERSFSETPIWATEVEG